MSITKKSTKLNSTMKKCEDFCKNDYLYAPHIYDVFHK